MARIGPIAFYYWTTPNGWKVAIMLEECELPYVVHPINIAKREQFDPAFLRISPNNKIPAIIDPEGRDGKPISVFESGAILQYLGRKTGRFYPADDRGRVAVDEWLFWQVGGLGPMAAQAHHFRLFAPENIPYAIERFTNECKRLYGVMDGQLANHAYLAGDDYSIADMAAIGWASAWERQGQNPDQFPNVKRWLGLVRARPAVRRGMALPATIGKP
jgi:GST-like protein